MQYHVIFDDNFKSINIPNKTKETEHWTTIHKCNTQGVAPIKTEFCSYDNFIKEPISKENDDITRAVLVICQLKGDHESKGRKIPLNPLDKCYNRMMVHPMFLCCLLCCLCQLLLVVTSVLLNLTNHQTWKNAYLRGSSHLFTSHEERKLPESQFLAVDPMSSTHQTPQILQEVKNLKENENQLKK